LLYSFLLLIRVTDVAPNRLPSLSSMLDVLSFAAWEFKQNCFMIHWTI